MKDLEKIKSEDLACQVADANPGNFAIEQEVAQLVGATVPQPTQPSADDARELGAQLLVFLRRALLPIRSALRTALAAIYAHLDSRCTDYTPAAYAPFTPTHHAYDPMGSTPRTVANLLTALTAFSARKIYAGNSTGVDDGVGLCGLLYEDRNRVTYLEDAKSGKTYTYPAFVDNLRGLFPNMAELSIGCAVLTTYIMNRVTQSTLKKITFSNLLEAVTTDVLRFGNYGQNSNAIEELYFPEVLRLSCLANNDGSGYDIDGLTELHTVYLPKLQEIPSGAGRGYWLMVHCPKLTELHMPSLKKMNQPLCYANCLPNLIDLELGCMETNTNLSGWNPTDKGTTFLQNFKEHIALRLTSNGSGKTLTLSQAVRDAIHAAEATYGIEAIIVTQKGWTLSPAPTA